MNQRRSSLVSGLRKMESREAADWLIADYPSDSPDYGEALLVIPHRSWRRSEQKLLARHYFKKLPFAGPKGYEAFTSIMSVRNVIACVREHLPMSERDTDLLMYYLVPALFAAAKTAEDAQCIDDLVEEVKSK